MRSTARLVTLVALTACARDASGPDDGEGVPEAGMAVVDAGRTEDAGVRDGGSTPSEDDADADEPDTSDHDACSGRCDAAVASSCDDGPAPGASIDLDGVRVSGVKVGGGGNTAEVEPGASVMVTGTFTIPIASCITGSVAVALQVGFEEGPTDCSGTSTCGINTDLAVSITAPTQPGSYGIYAATAANLQTVTICAQPFDDVPPESARIATICVK